MLTNLEQLQAENARLHNLVAALAEKVLRLEEALHVYASVGTAGAPGSPAAGGKDPARGMAPNGSLADEGADRSMQSISIPSGVWDGSVQHSDNLSRGRDMSMQNSDSLSRAQDGSVQNRSIPSRVNAGSDQNRFSPSATRDGTELDGMIPPAAMGQGPSGGAPSGIDPALWSELTPELQQHWAQTSAAVRLRQRVASIARQAPAFDEVKTGLRKELLRRSRYTHPGNVARLLLWLCHTDRGDTPYSKISSAVGCSDSGTYKLLAATMRYGLVQKRGYQQYELSEGGATFLESVIAARQGARS